MKSILLKVVCFPIMVCCFPVDYIAWNFIYGDKYGKRTFTECVKDGWKVWCEL